MKEAFYSVNAATNSAAAGAIGAAVNGEPRTAECYGGVCRILFKPVKPVTGKAASLDAKAAKAELN